MREQHMLIHRSISIILCLQLSHQIKVEYFSIHGVSVPVTVQCRECEVTRVEAYRTVQDLDVTTVIEYNLTEAIITVIIVNLMCMIED